MITVGPNSTAKQCKTGLSLPKTSTPKFETTPTPPYATTGPIAIDWEGEGQENTHNISTTKVTVRGGGEAERERLTKRGFFTLMEAERVRGIYAKNIVQKGKLQLGLSGGSTNKARLK